MTSNNIPVSFEFFKKYTYHEECVDELLKLKASGDQQKYDRLLNNREAQERALKAYYEAFYLRPEIREKYHIRLKSAPKSIKDKLLSIPVLENLALNKVVKEEQHEKQVFTRIHVENLKDLVANGNGATASKNIYPLKKRVLLATQDVFDGESVADDDEPAYSPDEVRKKEHSSFSEKLNGKMSTHTSASNCNLEQNYYGTKKTGEKSGAEKDQGTTDIRNKGNKNIINKHKANEANKIVDKKATYKNTQLDQKNVQQTKNTTSAAEVPSTSSNKNPTFNYKALIPYLHCCPLSFKEFCKFSNIDKLVAEFCKTKNMDAHQQRMILHRSHLLFYLAPEHRKLPPINEIQVSDNCPLPIKEKFFSIPANLYLKETKKLENLPETEKLCDNHNKFSQKITIPESNETETNTQHIDDEYAEAFARKTVSAAKTVTFNITEENKNKGPKASTVTKHIQVNNTGKNCLTVIRVQRKLSPASKTVAIDRTQEIGNQQEQTVIASHTAEKKSNIISNNIKRKETPAASNIQQKIINTENPVTQCDIKKECFEPSQQLQATPTSDQTNTDNNENKETFTSASSVIKFPVSLNDFKKHTNYEEVVEELFKLKAQDNPQLLMKFKSSKTIFDDTLIKYYRAFYLLPAVRDIWPIRLKPMPSFKKNLLLQIPEGVFMAPLNNFTVEQLILPDLNTNDVNMEECATSAKSKNAMKPIQSQSMEIESIVEPKICQTSSTGDVIMTAVKVETNSESSDLNKSLKRTGNEVIETPSPKRQKTEKNPDTAKKSYRELLPYAHCCPVSFSDFAKYSNVSELFSGYCQKRYNSVKKLPHMLKRAYILFYLAPENRNLKPFNKFKVVQNCPVNIKEKIFEIPTNLIKEEKAADLSMRNKMQTETDTQQRADDSQMAEVSEENNELNPTQPQKTTSQKPTIEILENRLLPPIKQLLVEPSNKEGSLCSNSCCLFSHIRYTDIKQHTNIPSVQSESLDLTATQNIFKQLIYKIVNGLSCDEKYMISSALTCKILKHKIICDKCEMDAQTLLNLPTPAASCSVSESDRTSNTSFETVIERCNVNNMRTNTTTEISSLENRFKRMETCARTATNENRAKSTEVITTKSHATNKLTNAENSTNENRAKSLEFETHAAHRKQQESIFQKSSAEKHTAILKHNDKTGQVATEIKIVDMWGDKKLLAKFCQKLLAKLQQSFDGSVDFCSETYKIFLECNEIPLGELLRDICDNNDNNVQSILNNTELYEALQRYYYFKYMTNKDFALKYPVKELKENDKTRLASEKEVDTSNCSILDKTSRSSRVSSKGDCSTLEISINIHNETGKDESIIAEKPLSNNNALEKAKRIFFRSVDKTHTLAYVVRTTFGYKQAILRNILNLTLDEFRQLTNVYEGDELYADNHMVECMYRYVCRTPLVWPTNLFITLENLCNFLVQKNIHFDNYSTMLFYISPKVLHWSNLLSCTNILDCVKSDYEKRTGNVLDTHDILRLKEECIDYYNRCWKHEKWLADTPLLDEEFCQKIAVHAADNAAVMTVQPTALSCCGAEVIEVAGSDAEASKTHAPNCVSDLIVLSPSEMTRAASADEDCQDFNCVLMPSTQQQIEMLPDEQSVSKDPLNNSDSTRLNLNVSQSSVANYEVGRAGEHSQPIKTEVDEKKLLSNLIFFEDENGDMQYVECEEEIVELDTTIQSQAAEENLPSSQIDFDVLINSDDFQSLLAQHFPHTADSSNYANSQQPSPQAGQLMQLQDVSLLSGGEKHHAESEPAVSWQDWPGLEPMLNELLQSSSDGSYFSAKNRTNLPAAQRLPSTFEETQTSSETSDKPQQQQKRENNKIPAKSIKEFIDTILAEKTQKQETKITDKSAEAGSSKTSCKSSYALSARQTAPKKRVTVINTKSKKNVATVKPLPNSNLVPQIQHATRPLQTVPAFPATTNNNKPAQSMAPTSLMLNLTPTSSSQGSTDPSSQNSSSIQLQLPHFGTHIFISQELNKNCSLFDNSSLLRIVDHNYHKGNNTANESLPHMQNAHQPDADHEVPTRSDTLANDETQQGKEQPMAESNAQPASGLTRRNSECLSNCSTSNTRSNLLEICNTNDNQQQPACRRIINRRISSLCKDSDEKVNNLTPVTNTNTLVTTSITITIKNQQILHPPVQLATQMARRVILYRYISKFHYFKELTPQHMSEYLLPSLAIGKSYSEALIVCENFKTRVSNRSISALFSYWPPSLQRDFLLVLNDLKEFHYNIFERKSMRKQEDLRVRVLFWLLATAPSFSLCHLVYEKNNSEFSHCEAIQSCNDPSYKRKPFKCLTNALNAKILKQLKEMKSLVKGK